MFLSDYYLQCKHIFECITIHIDSDIVVVAITTLTTYICLDGFTNPQNVLKTTVYYRS